MQTLVSLHYFFEKKIKMDLSLSYLFAGLYQETDGRTIRLSSGIMVMGTGFLDQQTGGLYAVAQEIGACSACGRTVLGAFMHADAGRYE